MTQDTIINILQTTALVLSLTGAYLVASKNKSKRHHGFLLWIFSNLLWFMFSISIQQSIMWLAYLTFAFKGYKENQR